jgi:hypothetical protein
LLHLLLGGREILLQAGVAGVMLQALLVGVVGAQQVALAPKRRALAAPALCPVGLDLGRLLGVLKRQIPLLLGGVGCRPVAVEDVVGGIDGDGLGELVAI